MRASSSALLAAAGLIAGCSGPHIFRVDLEGSQAVSAVLTINGEATGMVRSDNGFAAFRTSGDGSGRIDIAFADGGRVTCPIGYVTNGDEEPHRYLVEGRTCRPA